MKAVRKLCTKIKEKKGASMLLIVCLFLVLCVMGINLLNAANSNVANTALELEKEQTMLYVSSVYDIVNEMIENGDFYDAVSGELKDMSTSAGNTFRDAEGEDIVVEVTFSHATMNVSATVNILLKNGNVTEEYVIESVYQEDPGMPGKYKRLSCRGFKE